jgi:ribonuclease HI
MDIILFSDGSCVKNTKASYGFLVLFKLKNDNEYKEYESYCELLENKTNNRAELYGLLFGLKKVLEFDNFNSVKIYSDSQYTIKSITEWIKTWKKNGWKTANKKPVKNLDIIKEIDILYNTLLTKCNDVLIEHVYSHKKEPNKDSSDWIKWYGNNKVDSNIQLISKSYYL